MANQRGEKSSVSKDEQQILDMDEIRRLHPWEANRRDLVLQVPAGHTGVVVIDADGKKRGRIDLAMVSDEQDWEEELAAARAAKAGMDMLRGFLADWDKATDRVEGRGESARTRRAAFAEGLMEGIHGRHQEHPDLGHALPPEWSGKGGWAFRDGWQLGMGIYRALEQSLRPV